MKISILKNLKQVLLIVFSVVLGIFLSERIEERKNKEAATLLLSKIKSEVNKNKEILEDWLPYHKMILKRLDSLKEDEAFMKRFIDDELILYKEVLTRGTLMGESLSNDAWDIAKSHPLMVHFDYEDLLVLSKIYTQQANTYEPVPKLIELFLSSDFNTAENAKANLRTFQNQMHEVVTREDQLLYYFKEGEKRLKLPND